MLDRTNNSNELITDGTKTIQLGDATPEHDIRGEIDSALTSSKERAK